VSVIAYVGLGANLGDPVQSIRSALEALGRMPGSRMESASSLYRSDPVGHADQPEFVNAVARLQTELEASQLLARLHEIEAEAGRKRSFANAPRTLDLDLLLYGEQIIDLPELTVPHPRMHERRFVLEPLVEICPDCSIPKRGSAAALLGRMGGQQVSRIGADA
jgi:2-amino-4-hydroxy-6-hydroxymethyldihydropteridine diphosphokinase